MKYETFMTVTQEQADMYNRFIGITGQEAYDKYGLKGDECISETFFFEDGTEAEIKIVIPINEDSYTWTEGILYDRTGKFISCTEPCEDFLGEWCLNDHNNNNYTVNINILGGV